MKMHGYFQSGPSLVELLGECKVPEHHENKAATVTCTHNPFKMVETEVSWMLLLLPV